MLVSPYWGERNLPRSWPTMTETALGRVSLPAQELAYEAGYHTWPRKDLFLKLSYATFMELHNENLILPPPLVLKWRRLFVMWSKSRALVPKISTVRRGRWWVEHTSPSPWCIPLVSRKARQEWGLEDSHSSHPCPSALSHPKPCLSLSLNLEDPALWMFPREDSMTLAGETILRAPGPPLSMFWLGISQSPQWKSRASEF